MRFFTADWWFVVCQDFDRCEEANQAFEDYQRYIESVEFHLRSLPEQLMDPCGFHDDGIKSIEISLDEVTLKLIASKHGHPRTLKISGVRSVKLDCWDDMEDRQDPRHHFTHGDAIGYHELHVDEARGILIYTAILQSGTELELSGYLESIDFELIEQLD